MVKVYGNWINFCFSSCSLLWIGSFEKKWRIIMNAQEVMEARELYSNGLMGSSLQVCPSVLH